MGWAGPMTDRQQACWFAFLRWKNDPDHVDGIDMDGCVPPETQERWARRVKSVELQAFHAGQHAKAGGVRRAASGKPLGPAAPPRPAPPGAPPVTPRPNRWDVTGKTPPGVKQPAARAEPPRPEGRN